MADNEILVGTAMLNAVWLKQHNDMLDLILPFVKYAIGRKYKKGDRIEPGEIAACLNEELGYESIPHEVVATMLKRLSPSVLDRRRGEFWLKVGLEKDVKSYSDQRLTMKERHEKVGSTLAAYLNEKMPLVGSTPRALSIPCSATSAKTACSLRRPRKRSTSSRRGKRRRWTIW